jgi:Mn2+/Fe2+ NRAMP family transporter
MWSFPALLKVLLLMGLNVIVIPLVLVALIYLLNKTEVMGSYTAVTWQNIGLVICFALSIALALERTPGYFKLLGT